MGITIKYLQEYIKANDHNPGLKEKYFMHLAEETGELAKAMRKNRRPDETGDLKGTVDEELWDVMYYALALANCYGIDLETVIPAKERLNNEKYSDKTKFDADL